VPPEELVSFHSEIDLATALDLLSEYAIQYVKKPIYDPQKRTGPIGIDIRSQPWKKVLGLILSRRGLWYVEKTRYIEIVNAAEVEASLTGKSTISLDTGVDLKPNSREVKIETIFFEGDRKALSEIGLDWNTFYRGQVEIDASQAGALEITDEILQFKGTIPKSLIGIDLDVLLKVFDSKKIGKVLAQPQVVVTEGKSGVIQVGQDFSIKERDFAGNVIDRFYSTGTILNVTPYVIDKKDLQNKDKEPVIFLKVHVERSTAHPDVVSTIINKSQANSYLQLYDGEETLIAGLYSTEKNNLRKGVPILKDLPWWFFGFPYIFGFNRIEEVEKELVIIIRATLLKDVYERKSASNTDIMNLNQTFVRRSKLIPELKEMKSQLTYNSKPKVQNSSFVNNSGSNGEYHNTAARTNTHVKKTSNTKNTNKYHLGKITKIKNQLALVIWNPETPGGKITGKFFPVVRKKSNTRKVMVLGNARILETRKNFSVAKVNQKTYGKTRIKIGDLVVIKQ